MQTRVDNGRFIHRFLFSNVKGKQIDVLVEEKGMLAQVLKASYLNSGMEVTDANSSDYLMAINLIKSLNLKGNQIPVLVEANQTHVKAFYNDGQQTYEIVYRKGSSDVKSRVIAAKKVLSLPDSFSFENLVLPGNSTAELNSTI